MVDAAGKTTKRLTLIAALVAAMSAPAAAASSAWVESEGGAVRIVTTDAPDAEGRLKGAMEIKLKPGWKTYWRDPGSSGVAPSLDLGGAGAIEMQYPAPEWHNDGQYDWAGYTHSVAFPVTLTLNRSGPIAATAFIGLCETICIPFQAELALDPTADDPADAGTVEAAEARLPAAASEDFGIVFDRLDGDHLILDAALPSLDGALLFLAGEGGFQFGKPVLEASGAKPQFRVKVIARPSSPPGGAGLPYTLVTESGAVSGVIPYF